METYDVSVDRAPDGPAPWQSMELPGRGRAGFPEGSVEVEEVLLQADRPSFLEYGVFFFGEPSVGIAATSQLLCRFASSCGCAQSQTTKPQEHPTTAYLGSTRITAHSSSTGATWKRLRSSTAITWGWVVTHHVRPTTMQRTIDTRCQPASQPAPTNQRTNQPAKPSQAKQCCILK